MRIRDILDVVVLLRPAVQGAVMPRLMPKLVTLIMLTVVVGILAAAIILALFYAGYMTLVAQGYLPMQALLIAIGVALAFFVIGLLFVKRCLCQLKKSALPPTDGITRIIDAFVDGFSSPKNG